MDLRRTGAGETQEEKVTTTTRDREMKTTAFEGNKYTCPMCPYVSGRRNNVDRHVVSMHDPSTRTLLCCGQSYATKASFQQHVQAAHSSTGYVCSDCGRSFGRRALLLRHSSIHTGLKTFHCSSCKYATSHKTNLARHCRAHNHPAPISLEIRKRKKNSVLKETLPFSGDEGSSSQTSSPELVVAKKQPTASGDADDTTPPPRFWQPWTQENEEPLDLRRTTRIPKRQGYHEAECLEQGYLPPDGHLATLSPPSPILAAPRPRSIVDARIVILPTGEQVVVYTCVY